jgi:micrococcal nuclease
MNTKIYIAVPTLTYVWFLVATPMSMAGATNSLNSPVASKTQSSPVTSTDQECKTPQMIQIKDCHDGDTCQIITPSGLWLNVRLAGIDAPEISHLNIKSRVSSQPFADQSRDQLLKLTRGSTNLAIKQLDIDPYNRAIVEIYADGKSVNLKMLELGLAERYRGKSKISNMSDYKKAEQAARKAKKGIWGLDHYQSPSEWRKMYPIKR